MKKINEHIHGGNAVYEFERLGIEQKPVIDFSVNINPFGPPNQINKIWPSLSHTISDYPSINGEGIVKYFRDRFGLGSESIVPGNGSTELIYQAMQAFAPKNTVVITPSFHDYTRSAVLYGSDITEIDSNSQNAFEIPDIESIRDKFENADALFIGNPNNPTGAQFARENIHYLAEDFPDKIILVDEAFIQFVDNIRDASLLYSDFHPNIIVFHSLTKFYALAGLRIGAVLGHPDTIGVIRKYQIPWNINCIADKITPLLNDCTDYEQMTIATIQSEKQRIIHSFKSINGITIYPSNANFLLAKWDVTDYLDDLLSFLLTNGFYVRDCRNFPGLQDNYFRFAIRDTADNDLLLSNLQRCVRAYQ